MSVLLAYDCSGSTGGVILYHEIANKIANTCDKNNTKIIKWDDNFQFISFDELRAINSSVKGFGGTEIDTVAKAIIKTNFHGKLILITDGDVGLNSIDRCDSLLYNWKFESVDVHIIGCRASMSVSCPFTRYCSHNVMTYTIYNEYTSIVSITDDDISMLFTIDNINTVETFTTKYDTILKVLTARMMGRADVDEQIHDQLVRMQSRIMADISKKKTEFINVNELVDTLENNQFDESIALYKSYISNYYANSTKDITNKISNLLNISKGGLRHEFSHQLRRADVLNNAPVTVTVIDTDDDYFLKDFICPITYDNETDIAILIKEGDPILDGLDSKIIEALINCPLSALNNQMICDKIIQRFDVPLGVPSWLLMNEYYQNSTSPITRAEIMGSIYLGCNNSQIMATHYTIAKMLTQHYKRIGNMDLWIMVVSILLNRIPRFDDIQSHIKKKMRYVMKNRMTYASLNCNPQYLMMKVPLGVSLWMVATSPLLGLPIDQDMSRIHVWYLDTIYELTKIGGYTIQSDILETYFKRIKCLFRLLSMVKKSPEFIENCMRGLSMRCCKIGDTYIPIDGPIDDKYIPEILAKLNFDLPREDIYYLSKMVNANMSGNDVNLDINWKPGKMPRETISWPFYGIECSIPRDNLEVSLTTCRPLYMNNDKSWKDIAIELYKTTKFISINELYGRYVISHKKYPLRDDLIMFIYNYYSTRGYKSMPAPLVNFADDVILDYIACTLVHTPEEFARRFEYNMPIEIRKVNEVL
jgi:hypothetical protein